MLVSEIFHSIQGEGKLAGLPSTFIRTSGCNLRCAWCDTPYTSWTPEGSDLSIEAIMDTVDGYGCRHVVVTGGEPMIAPQIEELAARLRAASRHITIETAGTVFKPVECDLMSISPKLANSTPWQRDTAWARRHEKRRIDLHALKALMDLCEYQLKFVVAEPGDVEEIEALIAQLGSVEPEHVLLMPEGVTAEALRAKMNWVASMCAERGYRYCPRLQIELFGNVRGT